MANRSETILDSARLPPLAAKTERGTFASNGLPAADRFSAPSQKGIKWYKFCHVFVLFHGMIHHGWKHALLPKTGDEKQFQLMFRYVSPEGISSVPSEEGLSEIGIRPFLFSQLVNKVPPGKKVEILQKT